MNPVEAAEFFCTIFGLWKENDVLFSLLQVMEKGYKRLTPEQPVGLRHAGYVISVRKVIKVRLQAFQSDSPAVKLLLGTYFPSSCC